MKNKINNINREITKRKKFLKKEIKKIVLKSIIQNLNLKPKIRALAIKKNLHKNNNFYISRQKNNICLQTGRIKGVLNLTNFSRHHIKKLGTTGCLQNIKISSW